MQKFDAKTGHIAWLRWGSGGVTFTSFNQQYTPTVNTPTVNTDSKDTDSKHRQ